MSLKERSLERIKDTALQMALRAEERRRNVRDAFRGRGELRDRRLLLIDDVSTAGATL